MNTDGRAVLLNDPAAFILYYFGHKIDLLKDFHLRLVDTATSEIRSLILYPATHGKTTLVSTLLPIWGLCVDANIRISLILKNAQEATDVMRVIQSELLGNQQLITDFGPFLDVDDPTKPWALERLTIKNRTRQAKEATISVFGAGARGVLGYRSDWVIMDDVVTEKNSATPEQRGKLREWFNLAVSTMPASADDRITVVGTLFDPEDLYNDLIELTDPETGEPTFAVQREDAIVDEDTHETLWPEVWPWRRLMGQKAITGTLDFNKRFRNIAVDPSRMVFKEAYIRGGYIGKTKYPGCLDPNFVVGEYEDHWRRYGGFDPAVGLTKTAKFCAHLTIAQGSCAEHEKCFWVIDLIRDQMTLPQQADLIIEKHLEYGLICSRVEANSYQGGLTQVISERMERRGIQLKIEPHYTSRENKPDPEAGVQAMAPWFENGKVHIPWGNPESQRKMRQLVDELVQYPGRTTDTVMAAWFGWLVARQMAPRAQSFNRLRKVNSVWGKTTSSRQIRNPFYA